MRNSDELDIAQEAEVRKEEVLNALNRKLDELREFGGKTGKIAIPPLEKLLNRIKKGDTGAYNEAAKELGLEKTPIMGEQDIHSRGIKTKKLEETVPLVSKELNPRQIREITKEERKKIDEAFR